ncbi:hypothetical protein JRO89_XSUnG0026800 [Xanthoceras sorbifolium]|uniref:DUF7722 domain-containing protein n=1 Tax=Xanthoceras sorbifolium TaxID=99658 RepID=A0ABQ8H055_9ROSI|nr:hypothetical protein JRO89_XSUnG0026800 [Xanthoceras sorbifolium]
MKCNNVVGSFHHQTHDHQAILKNNSSSTKVMSDPSGFQMPLHYPRYSKADYETMEEWKIDMLLGEYGLRFDGSPDEKRAYAMGTFLWPDQY